MDINMRNNEEFIKLFNAGKISQHCFSETKLDWGTTSHNDRSMAILNNIGFGKIIADSRKVDRGMYKYIAAITTTGLKVCMTLDGVIVTFIPQQRYQLLKDFSEFFKTHPKAEVLLERADKNQQYNTQYR